MVNVKSDDRHQGLFGYLTSSSSSSWYVDFHNYVYNTTRLRSEATLRERVSCLLRCDPSGHTNARTHMTSNLSLCLLLVRVAHASMGVRMRFQQRNWLRYLLFTNATGTLADSRVRVRVRTFMYMVWNDRASKDKQNGYVQELERLLLFLLLLFCLSKKCVFSFCFFCSGTIIH